MITSAASLPKSTYNSTTAPGSSVSLANFSGGSALTPGYYLVEARVYFGPAVAPVDGTDNDNFFLSIDGTGIGGQLICPAAENTPQTYTYPQILTTTGAIAIKTKGAATTGVVYRSILTVTPIVTAT